MSEPLVVVRILSGPRDGERFATPLNGLADGALFQYLDATYKFIRDPQTGRWGAIPSARDGSKGRVHPLRADD
jgi:hypothetical protein